MVIRLDQIRGTDWPQRVAGVVIMLLCVGLAAGVAHDPVTTVILLVAAVAGVLLLARVDLALLVLVALEPFEGYAKNISDSAIKALGVLVFVAWLLRALGRTSPFRLGHPVVRAVAVLLGVLLAASVVHPNGAVGESVLTRYVSYLGVTAVLVDTMRTGLPPRRVAVVYVWSCSLAAVFGLVAFFRGELRAGGPVGDPNDFAFFLVAAVPLAAALRRTTTRRTVYVVALLFLTIALLATISRGAYVGVAAMIVYAIGTGRLRPRAVLAGALFVATALLIVIAADPGKLTTTLQAKGQVASQNVDDRLVRWRAAAEMTADYPVLGLGPGGFREHYEDYIGYVSDPTHPLDVAHEMYLEVSSELGVPGLAAFLGVLGFGFVAARRAARDPDPEIGFLGAATATAAVGTAVAAVFLTEQYYLPVWLLAALGAALDPRWRTDPPMADRHAVPALVDVQAG